MPAEKARERKKLIGSIGFSARSSQATKAATSATPAMIEPITSKLAHPAEFPRTSPQTTPNAAVVTRTSPGTSIGVFSPNCSFIRASASGIAIAPIGTLIQKIHSQLMPWTTAPPMNGPLATARPVIALKTPIAAPRFSVGKAPLRSARPSGMTSAAPAPWTARAAISKPMLGASAQAAEAAENSASPAANPRRRP